MDTMKNLPVNSQDSMLFALPSLIVPPETRIDSDVELIINIENRNINVREFAAYLALIDRVYGRMSYRGLMSYAHLGAGQLEIKEARTGSLELAITELLRQFLALPPLAVIWLFLKYLPVISKSAAESVRHLSEAYTNYEEGRLTRIKRQQMEHGFTDSQPVIHIEPEENRKELKKQLQADEVVSKLDEKRLNQLTSLLDALYAEESNNLAAPIRFSQKQVKAIAIKVRERT